MEDSNQIPEQSPGNGDHLPFWEFGTGHYGKTLGKTNRLVMSSCRELIPSWLDTVPVKKDGVFTIADYGANDGYSSMPLIESMIDHLRKKHGDDLAIQIIYEDQEKNDFNSLFNRLCDSTSYMSRFRNVYPFATNIGFYKRCVPDETCDVILCSMATHWLETLNMTFKDCLFGTLVTKEERELLSVEGARDWTKFLLLRSEELKPGGLLVTLNLASISEGDKKDDCPRAIAYKGGRYMGEMPIIRRKDVHIDVDASWKDLKKEKIITEEEYSRCIFKEILRTSVESKSPFDKDSYAVRLSGLTLEYSDQALIMCAHKLRYLDSLEKGEKKEKTKKRFADKLVNAHRVWGQSTFHSALSDMRSDEEKAAILDRLYKGFHTRVMSKDPASYACDILVNRHVAKKCY